MCVSVYIYTVNDIISRPLPFLWVSHCSPTNVTGKAACLKWSPRKLLLSQGFEHLILYFET